jgi:hypothetical protein
MSKNRNRSAKQLRKDRIERRVVVPSAGRFSLSPTAKMKSRDVFLSSELTDNQIYFMRFVGVRTRKAWIIDDDYRQWTKAVYLQRMSLRRMWELGAERIRALQPSQV